MDTSQALIRAARAFTAERGLSGFTVEELCNEAAVSRRTFFNYFASKEDAVLGIPLDRGDGAAIARFLAVDDPTPGVVSPTLLSDLAVLAIERWQCLDLAPESFADLLRAVDREPRLLGRMLSMNAEQERQDTRLIEQREHLRSGDLRAQAAAQIVGAISRAAAVEFLSPDNQEPYPDVFERRFAGARDLFASQHTLQRADTA